MVIGSDIGTTATVLLGAIGGTPPKKRVAASHLFFNLVTGLIAFLALPVMIMVVKIFVDVSTNGLVGIALFHTVFNITGVLIFLPIVGVMTTYLVKLFPEHKEQLCVHIANTPIEEVESAVIALKNEHLDLSTLFLVNRLFTQACRMMIFSIKDLKLTQEKANHFDKAIEPGLKS
ncbi:hypothetical protein [Desulfocicer niacini]